MGLLIVLILGSLSAALISFFGYQGWLLIGLGLAWLAAIVYTFLRGHQGFGGRGNTDLQIVIAVLFIAGVVILPNYVEHQHCGRAETALEQLAEAERAYFAGHKTYTAALDTLQLTSDPNIKIEVSKADERSFVATASHRSCDKNDDGAPDVLTWDSSRGVLRD